MSKAISTPSERTRLSIWKRLDEDLTDPKPFHSAQSIWLQVQIRPGGIWQDVQDETLLLDLRWRENLWQEANDETLLLSRRNKPNLWQHIVVQLELNQRLHEQHTGVWEKVEDETLILSRNKKGWAMPRLQATLRYKPTRALGWALKKIDAVQAEDYYVLKNTREEKYLKLNDQQVYLWNLMDGSYSVQDLAVANFKKYKTLSIEWLYRYLETLHENGFLAYEDVNVYQNLKLKLGKKGIRNFARRILRILIKSEVSIKGIDSFYTKFYRFGGKFIFTLPVKLIIWGVTLIGAPFFFYLTNSGQFSFINGSGESLGWGLIGLFVAQAFSIFTHESGHALTTKHYGRKIRRGGTGLYLGMLTFYMDTTDIWMEPRRSRLSVTWAGPLSGFFLGSLTSLLIWAVPTASWNGLAYQFATFCYWTSILNLNPLIKLDGYYLLMDWLELPMLRENSIRFVRKDLVPKLKQREKFNREQLIFAIYGILAIIWTTIFLLMAVRLYGTKLLDAVLNLV